MKFLFFRNSHVSRKVFNWPRMGNSNRHSLLQCKMPLASVHRKQNQLYPFVYPIFSSRLNTARLCKNRILFNIKSWLISIATMTVIYSFEKLKHYRAKLMFRKFFHYFWFLEECENVLEHFFFIEKFRLYSEFFITIIPLTFW